MKALTLWQPWAWAMAFAGKPVENRTWAPPHALLGQRIAIHAGKTMDEEALCDIADEFGVMPTDWQPPSLVYERQGVKRVGQLARGAVVAVGTLAGYVCDDGNGRVMANHLGADVLRAARASPWYQGPIGWIVVERIALPTPVSCRGAQGLWTLPPDVEAAVMRQIGEARV